MNVCRDCILGGRLEEDTLHMLSRDAANTFVWHQTQKEITQAANEEKNKSSEGLAQENRPNRALHLEASTPVAQTPATPQPRTHTNDASQPQEAYGGSPFRLPSSGNNHFAQQPGHTMLPHYGQQQYHPASYGQPLYGQPPGFMHHGQYHGHLQLPPNAYYHGMPPHGGYSGEYGVDPQAYPPRFHNHPVQQMPQLYQMPPHAPRFPSSQPGPRNSLEPGSREQTPQGHAQAQIEQVQRPLEAPQQTVQAPLVTVEGEPEKSLTHDTTATNKAQDRLHVPVSSPIDAAAAAGSIKRPRRQSTPETVANGNSGDMQRPPSPQAPDRPAEDYSGRDRGGSLPQGEPASKKARRNELSSTEATAQTKAAAPEKMHTGTQNITNRAGQETLHGAIERSSAGSGLAAPPAQSRTACLQDEVDPEA